MNQSTLSHLVIFLLRKSMADYLIFISVDERAQCKKNACWVFGTVRIISIIKSWICFTEKVYGSSPYSPKNLYSFHFLNLVCWLQSDGRLAHRNRIIITCSEQPPWVSMKRKKFISVGPIGIFLISDKKTRPFFFVDELHTNFSCFPIQDQKVCDIPFLFVQNIFLQISIYPNPIAHHSNSTDADFMQEG